MSTDLWQDFLTNQGKVVDKWDHYFAIYERHFSWYQGRTLTFLEIGVSKGGSLALWRHYFGPLCQVVGIDIDSECAKHERPGVAVRIGDQSDEGFLSQVIEEFGVPDIVLDDGSHQMRHISASFDFLYPRLPKNGVYMVEDLHCAYWEEYGGGIDAPDSFINRAKGFVDDLNADQSRGAVERNQITEETLAISFYPSAVVLEKGDMRQKTRHRTGFRSKLSQLKATLK